MTNDDAKNDYYQGLRDGKIEALEQIVKDHEHKFDQHETRLQIMERILYGLIGAFALIEVFPTLERIFGT